MIPKKEGLPTIMLMVELKIKCPYCQHEFMSQTSFGYVVEDIQNQQERTG